MSIHWEKLRIDWVISDDPLRKNEKKRGFDEKKWEKNEDMMRKNEKKWGYDEKKWGKMRSPWKKVFDFAIEVRFKVACLKKEEKGSDSSIEVKMKVVVLVCLKLIRCPLHDGTW